MVYGMVVEVALFDLYIYTPNDIRSKWGLLSLAEYTKGVEARTDLVSEMRLHFFSMPSKLNTSNQHQ